MAPTATNLSIIVNCQRTCSNLLRITMGTEGLHLHYLSNKYPFVVEQEYLPYSDYPELKEIAHPSEFDTVWDADMLWSLATIHEDHVITPTGHEALLDDSLWKSEEPDFVNLPVEGVA